MNEENTTDLTEALPTMNKPTRTRVKTVTALLAGAAVLGLIVDDQIRKFKDRKTVSLTVEDNSEN
jgi:hypothetical protein